jgi:signal transduction histidine kinase/ligand-binding sensor domain-containing protein
VTIARYCLSAALCGAIALSLLGFDAEAQYRVGAWTADNGLPIGSVNRVLQTRDGYLWLATYAGLVRYDGASFQVFNVLNSKGLRTSRFVSLFEDREGDLWAATEGHGLTRYHGGSFTTYTVADGLPSDSVGGIFYDTEDHLLIDSSKGLVEWRQGRFVRSHPLIPSESDRPGLFLGRTASGAAWYMDESGLRRFEHDRISITIPLHLDFKRACEERSGRLWLEYGHPDGSRTLAFYENGKLTPLTQSDGVPPFRTFGCFQDRKGTMWFGLQNHGGLLRIQGGKVVRFTVADGLPNDNVGLPYEDAEGTLWVPTDGGLSWFTRKPVQGYSKADGVAAENTYPVLQDRTGTIWIGSWPGITQYRDGAFTDLTLQFGMKGQNVMSLLEDRDGALWMGTWGDGIRRLKNGRAEAMPIAVPPGKVVRAMLQDSTGDVWVGGIDGLARYHDGDFVPVSAADGFAGQEVFSLFQDREGSLWVGTNVGASRYSGGRFLNFGEPEGFTGKVVRSFYEDAQGALWVGTYDTGLFRYVNGTFTNYTTRQGLLDNGAFQIIEDGRGNLWISCNVGLYRVAKKELEDVAEGRAHSVTAVTYGKRDGMLSAECNGGGQPAGIRTRDGRLWLPTQKGVAVIDPESITPNVRRPPVVIEQALVDQQPAGGNGTIEIRPGQSDLEIHYAALTFVRPELSRFKYRLEGLDTDWVDAGSRRTAYYSHLGFGTYRFRVIAANRDGVWNLEGATIGVRAIPPFWRTWWFEVLSGAGLVGLGRYFFRRRILRLQREQATHEAFARQLIESQERERKRIATELHDSLSQTLSIIKNRAVLSLQAEEEDRALGQMEEIAEAAGEALAEVREIVYGLRPVEIDRLGLTKAIGAMVKKVSASSGVRIHAQVDALDGVFSVETEMNLYRILQEGLSNIVKHSGASEAEVQIRRHRESVEIVMRDRGRGFSPDSVKTGNGSGLGLLSIGERARLIGGKFQVMSSLGHGTTLTIRITAEATHHG